jgi:TonB family protein
VGRDLGIGLCVAVVLHALAWGGGSYIAASPRRLAIEERLLARAVQEEVRLPRRPQAPKPPPPLPPPELPPRHEPPREPPRPRRQQEAPARQQEAAPGDKRDQARPSDGPPPLVLSKTYEGSGDGSGGVAVQTGSEDIFGDPEIEATPENTRPRGEQSPEAAPEPEKAPEPEPVRATPRQVVVRHAVPEAACEVEWPESAPPERRLIEVRLLLTVDLEGAVSSVRVLRSAGEPFDSTAIAALRRCRFKPGTRDGTPFVDKVPFVVEFRPSAGAL